MKPMLWQLSCVTVTNDCSLLFVIVHHNVCSLLLRVMEGSFKLRSSMVAKTLYEYGRSRWSAGQGTPAASAPRNRSDSELVDLAVTVDGFRCSLLGYGRVLNLDCLKQSSFRFSKSTLTSLTKAFGKHFRYQTLRKRGILNYPLTISHETYTQCRTCTQKITRLKPVKLNRGKT